MKYWIHTYGCQMNVRDGEAVAARLESEGLQAAERESAADLVIVNTCSVREKAEHKALGKLGLLCASKKRGHPERIVGAMGCMVQRLGPRLLEKVPGLDFAVGTQNLDKLPGILRRAVAGEGRRCEAPDLREYVSENVPRGHLGRSFQAYVTILLGCNRRCSYCIVPDVRGPEYSRPVEDIRAEVRALAEKGVREVTLLGQSVMRYGLRNPVRASASESPGGYTEPFPRLLETLDALPGLRRLRFTSGHPSGCTPELIRALRELPSVCPHLHLPVQSGSNRILARMRRGYRREEYLEAVCALRTALPDIALTTDIIVGFPGETEEDFEQTRALMDRADFDNAFIFKYSPRPGTPAAAWPDDVSEAEKLRRNHVLLADQERRGLAINRRRVGRTLEILVEGPSERNQAVWSGRTRGNKIALFDPPPGIRPGEIRSIAVTRALPQTLYGEVLPTESAEASKGAP